MDRTNAGRRIELVSTNDPYTQLKTGSQGTVKWERFDGFSNTVSVEWDDGSSLSLVDGEDRYRYL